MYIEIMSERDKNSLVIIFTHNYLTMHDAQNNVNTISDELIFIAYKISNIRNFFSTTANAKFFRRLHIMLLFTVSQKYF